MAQMPRLYLGVLVLCPVAVGQSGGEYTFRVPVNEVVVTFHAADAHGAPVTDLRADEVGVLDDGRPADKVLAFELEPDLSLRAAILLDSSSSMRGELTRSRSLAEQFARLLLRPGKDEASVTAFGPVAIALQSWTADEGRVEAAIRSVRPADAGSGDGTALFDAVFRTCFYETGRTGAAATGNAVLLFSDGQDTASHTTLEEAAATCQHSNTAVYAFQAPGTDAASTGPETLRALAAQTGGRVFAADGDSGALTAALRAIDAEVRSQYRLVYRPAVLRRDGAFHAIQLVLPARVGRVAVRSGYYAPGR